MIAFDNRGVGSSGGKVPDTLDDTGRDAVAFIRALGLTKVDLVGFSLGGGVAQMVALHSPELVRRNVLAGTGPKGGGGISAITRVVAIAYAKAALTRSDPRNFLFFLRNAAARPQRRRTSSAWPNAPRTVTSRSRCRHGCPSCER